MLIVVHKSTSVEADHQTTSVSLLRVGSRVTQIDEATRATSFYITLPCYRPRPRLHGHRLKVSRDVQRGYSVLGSNIVQRTPEPHDSKSFSGYSVTLRSHSLTQFNRKSVILTLTFPVSSYERTSASTPKHPDLMRHELQVRCPASE